MSAEEMRVRFVAALLAWHGVTAAELGRVLGNATATVYKKMAGERAFTTRDLLAIAEAFDIDPGLLLRPQPAEALLGCVRPGVDYSHERIDNFAGQRPFTASRNVRSSPVSGMAA